MKHLQQECDVQQGKGNLKTLIIRTEKLCRSPKSVGGVGISEVERIWKLAWAGRSISGGACEALVDVAWSGMSKGLGLRSRA